MADLKTDALEDGPVPLVSTEIDRDFSAKVAKLSCDDSEKQEEVKGENHYLVEEKKSNSSHRKLRSYRKLLLQLLVQNLGNKILQGTKKYIWIPMGSTMVKSLSKPCVILPTTLPKLELIKSSILNNVEAQNVSEKKSNMELLGKAW